MNEKIFSDLSMTYIPQEIFENLTDSMEERINGIFDILNNEDTSDMEKAKMLLMTLNTMKSDDEKAIYICVVISIYQHTILDYIRNCQSLADFSIDLLEILDRKDADYCDDDDDPGFYS